MLNTSLLLTVISIVVIKNGHKISNQYKTSKDDSQNKGNAPSVNNKPNTTLTALSNPIKKRERERREKKLLHLHCLVC